MSSGPKTERTIQADGHLHGVIVACQRNDGRWLLIRRSATVTAPLKVCFPGGGIDGSETQREATKREMLEEVNADINPLKCLWEKKYPQRNLTLWGWHAELLSETVSANPEEVAEILWLSIQEIIDHPDTIAGTEEFLAVLSTESIV